VLIHLGSEDLRVPNSQGMSLYHTLKARNVETKLVSWYCVMFALISCMYMYLFITEPYQWGGHELYGWRFFACILSILHLP
jgi:hypothetical protein